jgi:hypothetical protein
LYTKFCVSAGFWGKFPISLLYLYIFCIFMQKIFDKWAALTVCKVKIFTFVNIFTVL